MLNVSDTDLWQTCQRRDVVLITANRNDDGPDSLEATIQRLNRPSHLPILTISDAEQVLSNRDYATRIVARLLEYLLDLDNYRRTGRLYLS